jgi:hypothetical protein
MQRRGESGQPVKGRRHRATRPKARKALTAHLSTADLQEQLDRRTRELEEALQQQAATSEVLSIIRRSPADAPTSFRRDRPKCRASLWCDFQCCLSMRRRSFPHCSYSKLHTRGDQSNSTTSGAKTARSFIRRRPGNFGPRNHPYPRCARGLGVLARIRTGRGMAGRTRGSTASRWEAGGCPFSCQS